VVVDLSKVVKSSPCCLRLSAHGYVFWMCILVSISMLFVLIPRACRSHVGHMLALYKPQNMGDQNLNFFPLIVKHIFIVFRSFFMKKYLFRNNYVSKTNFWKVKPTSCRATCSLLSLPTKLEKMSCCETAVEQVFRLHKVAGLS
jgi:hypothetical protein